MVTQYQSTGAVAADAPARRRGILVWDAPLRVFHWLMVVCFAGAWLTAENDGLRQVHVTLGYTMGALVALRLVWGVVGSRHARFASFVRGPAAVGRYLRAAVSRHPEHHVGHNPAGALAIVAMLGLTLLLVATGWAHYQDIGGEWTEELHEAVANGMLTLVAVHVVAVLASSWLHRENLVGAMIHGRKPGAPDEAAARPWRGLAALLLALVLGFWAWQWRTAPAAPAHHHDSHEHHHAEHD